MLACIVSGTRPILSVIKVLIKYGARTGFENNYCKLPLHFLLLQCTKETEDKVAEIVQYLLANEVQAEVVNDVQDTALDIACRKGFLKIASMIERNVQNNNPQIQQLK